jgi:hypothetical protein
LTAKWIMHIEKSGQSFPSNFDFNFYFSGLKVALGIDHSVTCSKALNLVYKTLHFYPGERKIAILQDLLKKHFWRFFFHWSYNVREMLYLIIFYQIEFNFIMQSAHK